MKIYYDESPLRIRSMVPEDAKILYDTYLSYGWHPDIKVYEKYYREQQEGERLVFIPELQGAVKGQCTLVLHPATGPGNKLLDVAESEAAGIADTVFLAVGIHSGYGPAQRIYAKRGYIPDGTGVWYQGKVLDQYAPCVNDDDLVLFLSKKLR